TNTLSFGYSTRQMFSERARFDRADVVAFVEIVEIELVDGARAPERGRVRGLGRVARDRCIERGCQHIPGVDPVVAQPSPRVRVGVDTAVELHAEPIAGPRALPGVAVAQPAIGPLDLRAVDDALVKDSIVVAQPVAVARITEGDERIEKA